MTHVAKKSHHLLFVEARPARGHLNLKNVHSNVISPRLIFPFFRFNQQFRSSKTFANCKHNEKTFPSGITSWTSRSCFSIAERWFLLLAPSPIQYISHWSWKYSKRHASCSTIVYTSCTFTPREFFLKPNCNAVRLESFLYELTHKLKKLLNGLMGID